MTPGEREEIEKVAKKVCKGIPGSLHDIPACEIRHIKCKRCEKIEQAIITQVEKARAEQREIDAKICDKYTGAVCGCQKMLAEIIRNKLNQKGE